MPVDPGTWLSQLLDDGESVGCILRAACRSITSDAEQKKIPVEVHVEVHAAQSVREFAESVSDTRHSAAFKLYRRA